uniref:Uncharacterized protein n=1 Tax=Triticum urartu TaxID=4572 RepID=A0A8R7JV03_TRIUA
EGGDASSSTVLTPLLRDLSVHGRHEEARQLAAGGGGEWEGVGEGRRRGGALLLALLRRPRPPPHPLRPSPRRLLI